MKKALLPLVCEPDYSPDVWVVSDSNRMASLWLEHFDQSQQGKVTCLCGPKGSGKTHFAYIFKKKTQAVELFPSDCQISPSEIFSAYGEGVSFVLDNIELFDERWLCEVFNRLIRRRGYALLTLGKDLATWHFGLLDLDSRIRAANVVTILPPDDALIMQLICKKCKDEGARIDPASVEYLMQRIPRSFEEVLFWAQKINEYSLLMGREITKPLIRLVLTQSEQEEKEEEPQTGTLL